MKRTFRSGAEPSAMHAAPQQAKLERKSREEARGSRNEERRDRRLKGLGVSAREQYALRAEVYRLAAGAHGASGSLADKGTSRKRGSCKNR